VGLGLGELCLLDLPLCRVGRGVRNSLFIEGMAFGVEIKKDSPSRLVAEEGEIVQGSKRDPVEGGCKRWNL
jgi:hypothetical protein